MRHFYVLGNTQKQGARSCMAKIEQMIENAGGNCILHSVNTFDEIQNEKTLQDIPKETDCILVLGGDGTLIRCANATVKTGIPLVGIDLGTLGYLCDIDESNIEESVSQMLKDEYFIENRMMLSGVRIRENEICQRKNALNDIVIYRYGDLRVVDFIISVNGSVLNTFSADGIIVATPTGSTGYSMSCGGPIIDPAAQMILITPISPHTLTSRSIVLNPGDEITVEIGRRHPGQEENVRVSFDGSEAEEMAVGDKVVIARSEDVTKLLKLRKLSFLDNIRKKMK